MRIISASRRSDIAALYTPWFLERVREGWCEWRNPFGGQMHRVSLRPEDVAAIVFWTRFPAPLLPHLDELRGRGYRFYFHFTINGYQRELETHSPPVERAVEVFRRLSDRMTPEFVQWRYDPIIVSAETPRDYHLERFEELSRAVEGFTQRCYFSFVDYYGKTRRNLAQLAKMQFEDPALEAKRVLARELAAIAAPRGITLYACCEEGLAGGGIEQAHCVDADLVRRLRPDLDQVFKSAPTREACGCVVSSDIGAYDTCVFGCRYCYATSSRPAAQRRRALHDWRAPGMC